MLILYIYQDPILQISIATEGALNINRWVRPKYNFNHIKYSGTCIGFILRFCCYQNKLLELAKARIACKKLFYKLYLPMSKSQAWAYICNITYLVDIKFTMIFWSQILIIFFWKCDLKLFSKSKIEDWRPVFFDRWVYSWDFIRHANAIKGEYMYLHLWEIKFGLLHQKMFNGIPACKIKWSKNTYNNCKYIV